MAPPSLEVLDINKLSESVAARVKTRRRPLWTIYSPGDGVDGVLHQGERRVNFTRPRTRDTGGIAALRQARPQSSEAFSSDARRPRHAGRGRPRRRNKIRKRRRWPSCEPPRRGRLLPSQNPSSRRPRLRRAASACSRRPGNPWPPRGRPVVASPVASPVRAAATPVAAPVARRASPVKPKLDPNVVLRPAIASRASPRTDLSAGAPRVASGAPRGCTGDVRPKTCSSAAHGRRSHHAVLDVRAHGLITAAKSAFADPATREVT